MPEEINGIIERRRTKEEAEEEESCTTLSDNVLYQKLMCPSFRSFSSLPLLECDEEDKDEEECRLIKLNNAVKKLLDTIDDPMRREDVSLVCCLLCKFLKYNGTDGFYVKHLPQIDEIIEFLSIRSKQVDEYLEFLYALLELCSKNLLLQRSSEILNCSPKLQHHFSLLGYLLVLAPTRRGYCMAKMAIENLANMNKLKVRRDSVKPDIRREAIECSRLPLTLAELAEIASNETYPEVLEIILALVSVSKACCYRMLEVGFENHLLLRMHPAYGCRCLCNQPITENTDLQLDKECYLSSLEYGTKILQQLMTSLINPNKLPEYLQCLTAPTQEAMWGLRAALRREVLRAGRSSHSRKLRNELVDLIYRALLAKAPWEFIKSGILKDLATLCVATELDVEDTWAEKAAIETNNSLGLIFKRSLLLTIATFVEEKPDSIQILKNNRVIAATLRLMNPNFEATIIPWNSAQHWHLFKYASNALTYLVPKISKEFIAENGSLRLLGMFESFLETNFDDENLICLTETICSLSLAKCECILNDFRKHEYVSALLEMVDKILKFKALSKVHQTLITYHLVTVENIVQAQKCEEICKCESIVKIIIDLLQRCLYQKHEDSEFEQSFLVAIGTFAWKCLLECTGALDDFLSKDGLYLILDLINVINLPVQNLYLGLVIDICENEQYCHYLFSWKCINKKIGLMSLLVNIWKEEEKAFGVERTQEGCIENVDSPILNDEQWLYVFLTRSVCNLNTVITTAVGPARPKIYYLRKLLLKVADKYQEFYYRDLLNNLSTEDEITLLTIDSYVELKEDEVMHEISDIFDCIKIRPLTRKQKNLRSMHKKLKGKGLRIREDQEKLLELKKIDDMQEERETFLKIRDAKLNAAFDALEVLAFIGRTSCKDYRVNKKIEQTKIADSGIENLTCKNGPLYRTYDFNANVTTVFNQLLKIQSISKHPSMNPLRTVASTLTCSQAILSPTVSSCSLSTFKSDSSFLLKKYRFDSHGNICFQV